MQEPSRILKVRLRKLGGTLIILGLPKDFKSQTGCTEPPASVDCDSGFLLGVHVHFCSGASEPTCLSLRPQAWSWPSDLPHFSDGSNRAIIKITDFQFSFSLVRMAASKLFTCRTRNKKAELSFWFLYFPVKALLFSMIINKIISHFILNSQLFVILWFVYSSFDRNLMTSSFTIYHRHCCSNIHVKNLLHW